MKILNLEDNVFKHLDICKVIERGNFTALEIDWVRNLEEGILGIEKSIVNETPYDLIITDMWYPQKAGGTDADSGEELFKLAAEKEWDIPIILCSSGNYRIPGILGSVHYSENEDWETELLNLIKKL